MAVRPESRGDDTCVARSGFPRNVAAVAAFAAGLLLLLVLSRTNYLLFHGIVEMAGIVVAAGIFMVAWNTRRLADSDYLLFLAIAYVVVALVSVVHMLSYRGMGVFPAYGTNESLQFWLLARCVEAVSLLIAPVFLTRKLHFVPMLLVYLVVTTVGLVAIGTWKVVPTAFIEGQGLTAFKIGSEYAICMVFAAAIVHTSRRKDSLAPGMFRLLMGAMIAAIAAELTFTVYVDPYDITNTVGHVLKVLSVYILYRAVVVTSLSLPYEALFRRLKESGDEATAERDLARHYLDVAGVMLVALDRQGTVSLINKRGLEILGLPEAEVLGQDWFQRFLPSESMEPSWAIFQRLLDGDVGLSEDGEQRIVDGHGVERMMQWHHSVLRDAGGLVVGTLSSGEDVSDRRRTEEALRHSEERYRNLFENSVEGIIMVDLDGRITAANSALLDLFDVVPELGVGMFYSEFLSPDSIVAMQHIVQTVIQTGREMRDISTRLSLSNGKEVWVELNVGPVHRDGILVGVQGVLRDVTERMRTERAVVLERDRFMSLFNNSPEAVVLLGDEFLIEDMNPVFESLFGYSIEEVRGMHIDSVIVAPGYEDEARELTRLGVAGGLKSAVDTVRRRKDGSLVNVSVLGASIVSGGKRIGHFGVYRDVTDWTKAETALRDSEEQYRTLFEQSRDAIYLVAADGRISSVNDVATDLFGYSRKEMTGMHVTVLYADPSEREKVIADAERSSSGLKDYEIRLRRSDGTIIDCLATSTLLHDDEGKMAGFQSLIRDVTARKAAGRALFESEERYRRLFEESIEGAFTTDLRGKLTSANAAFIKIFSTWGTPSVDTDFQEFFTADSARRIIETVEGVMRTREPVKEMLLELKPVGGETLWVEMNASPIVKESQVQGIQGTARDVTPRKRVEDALRESEERYRSLFELSNDAISLADAEGMLIDANEAFLSLFGMTRDDMAGLSMMSLLVDALADTSFVERLSKEGLVVNDEVQFKKKDGTVMDCLRTVLVWRDDSGRVIAHQGLTRDITQQKRDQSELERSRRELRALTMHLQSVREEERASVAWELHDEIGQALSALRMDLGSCESRLPADVVASVRPRLDSMVSLMDNTIERLRRLYSELRPGMLDDLGIASTIEWQSAEFARRTGIECRVVTIEHVELASADCALALYRVFQEILDNVARHSGATSIDISLAPHGRMAQLKMADNGRGIADDELKSPLALGLAEMRERLHSCGGRLHVRRNPEGGTVVDAEVPLAPTEGSPAIDDGGTDDSA